MAYDRGKINGAEKRRYPNAARKKQGHQSQVTFDADFNVPDVKPDIGRMIQHKGDVSMDEVRLNEGRGFLRGSLNVDLLYVGEEGGKSI